MGRVYKKIYDDKINIDKKLWKEILSNEKITSNNTQDILDFYLKQKDKTERAGIVAKNLKYAHCAAINGIVKSFAWRIINSYPKISCPKYDDGRWT